MKGTAVGSNWNAAVPRPCSTLPLAVKSLGWDVLDPFLSWIVSPRSFYFQAKPFPDKTRKCCQSTAGKKSPPVW